MKHSNFFVIVLTSLLFVNCTNDDSCVATSSNAINDSIVILQERSPLLPKHADTRPIVLEKKKQTRAYDENGALIGNSDKLLGYSYSVGNSILGDYNNVKSPVVDIDKVKNYSTDYITGKSLQYFGADRFSFSNENSYESKLSETKKVATGFSLNLGLFKIGRKKTVEKIFGSTYSNNNKSVFGELTMAFYNSSFNLQSSEGSRKLYARECLSPVFLKNLYSSTIGNIIDTYGAYVLTGYMTGGKAFAMYAGEDQNALSTTSKEDKMDELIEASYSWKKDSSASGNYNFGRGNSSYESISKSFKNLRTKLWTYGGVENGSTMNNAQKLDDVNIDLGSWVASLSNPTKHTIIDITQNGLYPMSSIVLEDNFKRRFDDTSLGILQGNPYFVTPYIEIVRVFERYSSSGVALYDIAAVLNTRQGDKVILKNGNAATASDSELLQNENASVFMQKALAIKQQKQAFYDLEIRTNSSTRLNPIMGKPLCFVFDKFNESSMYKYTNPKTGMQYIFDTKKKVAFCHFTDDIDGDWILDEYGIRDWVESLPHKSIAMATLANSYKIIGL